NSFKTLPSVRFSSTDTVLNSSNNPLTIPLATKNFNRKFSTSTADVGVNPFISSVNCLILSCNIVPKIRQNIKTANHPHHRRFPKNLLLRLFLRHFFLLLAMWIFPFVQNQRDALIV